MSSSSLYHVGWCVEDENIGGYPVQHDISHQLASLYFTIMPSNHLNPTIVRCCRGIGTEHGSSLTRQIGQCNA